MIEKLSSFISNLFNPVFSFLFFLFILCIHVQWRMGSMVIDRKAILISCEVPILGYIYYNVKQGSLRNMDVSTRKQRNSLYYYIIASITIIYCSKSYYRKSYSCCFYYLTGLFMRNDAEATSGLKVLCILLLISLLQHFFTRFLLL